MLSLLDSIAPEIQTKTQQLVVLGLLSVQTHWQRSDQFWSLTMKTFLPIHSTVLGVSLLFASISVATAQPTPRGPVHQSTEIAVRLPAQLEGLGLTHVQHSYMPKGELRISGRLPNGDWVRVESMWSNQFKKVKTDMNGSLPKEVLQRLLTPAMLKAPELRDMVRVQEVEMKHGLLEVEGFSERGQKVEVEFAPDGRVIKYERKYEGYGQSGFVNLSADNIRQQLSKMGYKQISWLDVKKKHIEAEAVNTYGERVELKLDLAGRVERERMLSVYQ
jgi:hypothetical protein